MKNKKPIHKMKSRSKLARFRQGLLIIAIICAILAGVAAYRLINPAMSTRPGKALIWSAGEAGKLLIPSEASLPLVCLLLAVLGFLAYMTHKHRFSMLILWGSIVGLILALMGCTPY